MNGNVTSSDMSTASDADGADVPMSSGSKGDPPRERSNTRVLGVTGVVLLIAASPAFLDVGSYWLYIASLTLIYVLAASGLNLILGYAGQMSLAQGAFMGVGGYAVGILSGKEHWPVLVSIVVGAVLGFALGLLVGAPALRVYTHYLSMITLAIEVIYLFVVINQSSLTGGALGIADVPRPSIGSWAIKSDHSYHVFVAVVVVGLLAALYVVLNSPWGRAFKSIRENEMRAWMLGVNVRAYKLLAFAIGCGVASVAGGLLAPLIGFVEPDTYPLNLSFMLLLMVVVGGRGRIEGPIIGAVLVTVAPELLSGTQSLYLIIFASATLIVLMFMPKGVIALWDLAYLKVRGKPAPQLTK